MKNVGVVFPYVRGSKSFLKRIFTKSKFETVPVEEYGFNFICVSDNQNCSKIFNKNGVEDIVLMTDKPVETCNFRVIKGDRMFRKLVPDFVRKTAKSYEDGCSVTVVDKNLSKDGMKIVENLCSFCGEVRLNTRKKYDAERLCDRLLDKYGIVVNVISDESPIDTDIVVVLEDCGNEYGRECTVIDKDCKRSYGRVINDFYIPFRIKPPFGMSNLVFAECLDAIDK